MAQLFNGIALKISNHFKYNFDQKEFDGDIEYLHAVKKDAKRG